MPEGEGLVAGQPARQAPTGLERRVRWCFTPGFVALAAVITCRTSSLWRWAPLALAVLKVTSSPLTTPTSAALATLSVAVVVLS